MLSWHRGAPLRLAKSSSNVHPDAVWGSGFRVEGFMVDKLISPKLYGKVAANLPEANMELKKKIYYSVSRCLVLTPPEHTP